MNGEPIFKDLVGIMAVVLMVPVIFLWLERRTGWKVFDYLPAIIWIFLTPVFLSNFGVIPRQSPVYDTFKSFAVPLFIVLMLLDINIRQAMKVAWRGAIVLVIGSVGVVVGAAVAFVTFRSGLPENAWSGFGALAGSWIGGTGNLAAVAESVGTPSEQLGLVVIVDNFVYLAYFPLILMCKRWAKPFDRWTGVSQAQLDHFAEATQQVERKTHEVHFRDILTLLGWAFVAVLAANWLASLVPPLPPVLTQKTWALLLVTSFGIILSATKLRDVPGTEPLAMAFVYIYMTMIGASADLRQLGGGQFFLLAGFLTIVVHLAFVLLGAKLLKLDVSMAAVASVAAVGGAASAPVAAGYHREELVPISIMLALIGYALGNYLGVATAYLCHLLT
ncbi:MAG: DUF819 family protein [Candidatus Palauibacterales bacterium]|nr:DUF819 family protein [Candidatus Palauibacterales bacterium]